MSGKIPSRRERLRRAGEASEKLKDQFGNADDIYEDVREVVDTEDPSIKDRQLPEAIANMSAETIEFEEQQKAFSVELETLNEEGMELEEERDLLAMELQSSQLTNEEPEQFTRDRLAWIKRLFEADSKLAALVFEDQPLFQESIRDIRAQGNQLLAKMHYILEDVHSVKESIQSAKEEYDERLTDLVEPLQQDLHHTKQQLADSKALASSTDEELAKVKEELRNVKQEHQTSELALQKEIEKHKAGIERLQTEAETSLRQNKQFQNEIQRLESEKDEERTSSRQKTQQLHHFLYSKLLSIQNDQVISLPAASGDRFRFKRQQLSISWDTLAQWIQGPLKETLDTLTNSTEDTSNLAKTYQLVLGSLICLQSSSDIQDKESLLECMGKFQTWLTKACKDRTSILGLALARSIKSIQEGPQSDPWFSTDQFNASRIIDSRNSELPETTSVIADGFSGIVLLLQGTDIQVCENTDIFMRQQTSCGMQLVFNEALNLPALQLLADSWPHIDRWEPLGFWAVKVGRFNLVKKSGRIYEPGNFKED